MKSGLAEVRQKLSQCPAETTITGVKTAGATGMTAPRRAAAMIQEILEGQVVHVS
jgi:acetyl-CoA acetyltransferase